MKTTDTHVYFYGATQCFSNWHHNPKQFIDPNTGISFNSTEQHFMWSKAQFFNDPNLCDVICQETEQRKIKALGRQVKGYNDVAWDCVRFGFMLYANYLKYSQNESMKKELLDTGTKVLVEASPYDTIWGVGLKEDDPLILDNKNWRGKNMLGRVLMVTRTILSTNDPRRQQVQAYSNRV